MDHFYLRNVEQYNLLFKKIKNTIFRDTKCKSEQRKKNSNGFWSEK